MKTIKLVSVIVVGIILVAVTSHFVFRELNDVSEVEPINCDTLVPVYFKPSELQIAAKMKSTRNIIAVIPENNTLLARTEVLECPNFNYRDYIEMNW